MSDMLGRVIDQKYRIVRLLGEGGMGSVYEAEHTLLGRKVALKILHREYVHNPEALGRFFQEAKAASEIGHPNIIEVQDVGSENEETVFLVMELLNGSCLEEYLAEEGRLDPERAVSIALQVLSALHAAHKKGIIHRDLKSDNVFLAVDTRGREEIRLLDFGIAKIQKDKTENLRLTKTGNVVGTPYYFSPEQARGGREIDLRLDIWGVGVLLYEMLSGCLPFRSDNYNELLGMILMDQPTSLKELVPDLPDGLVNIVEKAMQKNPDDRFPSARKMMEALYPFNTADEMMSTSVRDVIHDSLIPPPYRSKSNGTKNGEESTADFDISSLPVIELQSNPGRKIALVAAAVAAALGIGIPLYLSLASNSDVRAEQTASGSNRAAEDRRVPAAQASTPNENSAVEACSDCDEELYITLAGLPDGAKASVDGKAVSESFQIPKTDQPHELLVFASGFKPYKKILLLVENQIITIQMEKIDSALRSKNRVKSKKRRVKKKRDSKSGWEDNPFQ